jgi:hypothetical protein
MILTLLFAALMRGNAMPDVNPIDVMKGLGMGIYRLLWGVGVVLGCVLAVIVLVIVNLNNVAQNQRSAIENQKAIAAASELVMQQSAQVVKETLATVKLVNTQMATLGAMFEKQGKELAANRTDLAEIVAAERLLVTEQAGVLEAARDAAGASSRALAAANAAAGQARSVSRVVSEKVVTEPAKKDLDKQKAKLAQKTQAVVAKGQKLDALAGQYKKAIRKVEH